MADLDQISAMIGGLRADMKRVIEWTVQHEANDERRFEDLADKIDEGRSKQGDRVLALELVNAERRGSWKTLSLIGAVTGGLGSFLYHMFGQLWR